MEEYSKQPPQPHDIGIVSTVEGKGSNSAGQRLNTINGYEKTAAASPKSQLTQDKAGAKDKIRINTTTTNGQGRGTPQRIAGLNSNRNQNNGNNTLTKDNSDDENGIGPSQNTGAASGQVVSNNTAGNATPGENPASGEKDKSGYTKNSAVTPSSTPRPTTTSVNTDRGQGLKRKIVGFDNSDKNQTRENIGSCTDQVAAERVKFRAWQEPDLGRQKRLVERLAPYRPPPPPDPRFNTWINHFEYYWKIGVDEKPTRRGLDDSLRSNIIARGQGDCIDINTHSSSSFTSGYRSQYHRNQRLLGNRPQTTPGRVTMKSGEQDNDNEGGTGGGGSSTGSPYGDRVWTTNGHGRTSHRSKSDGHLQQSLPMISGLDRRYMGLQSVRGEELQGIVGRLTRMTSAYHAKFAPNPHVWCDNSPGAHMVIKRENTIA